MTLHLEGMGIKTAWNSPKPILGRSAKNSASCQKGEYTDDLFSISQPAATEKVMSVLDSINERWGRGTLSLASVPTNTDWGMRREMMSQSFSTLVDQL